MLQHDDDEKLVHFCVPGEWDDNVNNNKKDAGAKLCAIWTVGCCPEGKVSHVGVAVYKK